MNAVNATIKTAFAVLAAGLFGLGAISTLTASHSVPGYTPNTGQQYLIGTLGGALIAFITAQLGLASANDETTVTGSLNKAMGTSSVAGSILLAIDVAVFMVVGVWAFVIFISPSLVAVPEGAPPLRDAPEYIQNLAILFGGVLIATFAALSGNVRSS